jgi:hypothetical protein
VVAFGAESAPRGLTVPAFAECAPRGPWVVASAGRCLYGPGVVAAREVFPSSPVVWSPPRQVRSRDVGGPVVVDRLEPVAWANVAADPDRVNTVALSVAQPC